MALADLAADERPREKAVRYGLETLSDAELLAVLLQTGYRGRSVLAVAAELLEKSGGLYALARSSLADLKIKGLGPAKGLKILASFELGKRAFRSRGSASAIVDAADVYRRYGFAFKTLRVEKAAVLLLDSRRRPLRLAYIGSGGKTRCSSDLRLCMEEALKASASFVVLIHNHPEGPALPSPEDDMTTELLRNAGAMLGIVLLDHLIIGEDGYYSYVERERLPAPRPSARRR